MENWINKYSPKTQKSIVGQKKAIEQLKNYLLTFNPKNPKFALIYGPTGTGKTSSVYALANDFNYDVLELNASESRNQKSMASILEPALAQTSLLFKKRLILVDEIDGLSSAKDRGGLSFVEKIKNVNYPIILSVNDPFDRKFSKLRKASILIEFEPLHTDKVALLLSEIAKSEGIVADPSVIKRIARMSGGDARSAINDLWIVSINKKQITEKDLDIISYRDRSEKIGNAMIKVFRSSNIKTAFSAFDDVDVNPDEYIMWIDYNLPSEFNEPEEIEKAYYWLSKASLFRSRIMRRQNWRLLAYYMMFITGGISSSKKTRHTGHVKYKEPDIRLKIWIYNNKIKKTISIISKIKSLSHLSSRTLMLEIKPYLRIILKNKKFSEKIKKESNLTIEEINYIVK